ncbi:hypothetical protein Ctob_016734 [Chrysochromulina tobinii]|uniref:Uncharacterized protein n=1 Tax=Chrysochromulina tobinii TaxID=1460289 RepID=A0A0M0KA99_9EUKA|nr:hypothetical protein Ctob_016734 [Chrysochromulina tobinii]|eukprot:KOO35724.1 hypothetical protein Ctob_016734 [Chrysochromulina sp. CCMP291]
MTIASKDKKPTLQLVYMQANALHQGEQFDVTCFSGATRKDLRSLAELEVDPVAQIVTVIIDVITDKGATHFVKAGSGSVDESKDDEDEDDEDKDDNVGDEDKDKDVLQDG